jgi:hypothetical protein
MANILQKYISVNKRILIAFATGFLLMFLLHKCNTKEVKIPLKVDVKIPSESNNFKPIDKPKPIEKPNKIIVVDSSLVEEYKKANDSLKERLFEKAITNRDYKEVFEDDLQTITVKANVTGTLNTLSASYVTKERVVTVDTTVTFRVPENKRSIILYGEVGVPLGTTPLISGDVVPITFKVGADIVNKKNWVYGVSYDTNETFWGKIGKKFDF